MKMEERKPRFWKISPGRGGAKWGNWLKEKENVCILYHWSPYFSETDMDLKKSYAGPEEFFGKTGKPHLPHDWRSQLKAFVWDAHEGDIVFAYKKGSFVGWGKLGSYFHDSEGHKRKITWEEIKPPLSLEKASFSKKLSSASAGTFKNLDEYQGEIIKLIKTSTEFEGVIGIGKSAEPKKPEEELSELKKEIKKIIETTPEEKTNAEIEAEAIEGERRHKETISILRDPEIVKLKKSKSDYRCEVCGFKFEEKYGEIGRNYIAAHHLDPLKEREKASKTTLDDLALVCDNCHRMLHRKDPPLTIKELKSLLK